MLTEGTATATAAAVATRRSEHFGRIMPHQFESVFGPGNHYTDIGRIPFQDIAQLMQQ